MSSKRNREKRKNEKLAEKTMKPSPKIVILIIAAITLVIIGIVSFVIWQNSSTEEEIDVPDELIEIRKTTYPKSIQKYIDSKEYDKVPEVYQKLLNSGEDVVVTYDVPGIEENSTVYVVVKSTKNADKMYSLFDVSIDDLIRQDDIVCDYATVEHYASEDGIEHLYVWTDNTYYHALHYDEPLEDRRKEYIEKTIIIDPLTSTETLLENASSTENLAENSSTTEE